MNGLSAKKEIIQQLKEKILVMERFRTAPDDRQPDFGLGPVNAAFPGGVFPTGAVHEFVSPTEGCAAAASGFISGLLSTQMKQGGTCLWVSKGRRLFPPALKFFGVEPDHVIFIDVKREKEVLWVMEQALKCNALAAVVAELRDISFAESRRLQLAAGESRVTGYLHRHFPRAENTLACVSRWKISPLPSQPADGLPGVGFPRWEVELMKIRNGRPGTWQIEWRNGTFRHMPAQKQAVPEPGILKKKHYA
ncbi:MAG: ImuA family protein [Mangrovibacterium sp.]